MSCHMSWTRKSMLIGTNFMQSQDCCETHSWGEFAQMDTNVIECTLGISATILWRHVFIFIHVYGIRTYKYTVFWPQTDAIYFHFHFIGHGFNLLVIDLLVPCSPLNSYRSCWLVCFSRACLTRCFSLLLGMMWQWFSYFEGFLEIISFDPSIIFILCIFLLFWINDGFSDKFRYPKFGIIGNLP